MPLKSRDIKKALIKKGFKEEIRHHVYYFFVHEGEKITTLYTKISHADDDIGDRLCGEMARQMKLSNPQFRSFVDCKLTSAEYLSILISGGHL